MKTLLSILFLLLMLPTVGMAVDYSQDANCKLAYLFEEGTGTTTDDASTQDITGNFDSDGNPAWWNTSLPGAWSTWAVDFSTDKIITASSVGVAGLLSSKSYSVWVDPDTLTATNGWVVSTRVHADSAGYVEHIRVNSAGAVRFAHRGATTTLVVVTNTGLVTTTGWYHIGISWDGSITAANVHIYVNGVEASSYPTQTDGNALSSNNTYVTKIGYDAANDQYFDGQIDEFAMFNRELSGAEFADIYANGLAGSATTSQLIFVN